MKKITFLLSVFACCCLSAQKKGKDYTNIIRSNGIYEINAFLRDAHPDDPRRSILKPRVMDLMREYIKNAHPADQKVKEMQEMLAMLKRRPSTKITFDEMNAIIKQKQIAKYKAEQVKQPVFNPNSAENAAAVAAFTAATSPSASNAEAEEFNMLMAISPIEHKNKTVKILNALFDNDPNAKEYVVLIENKSDCNIIVRMESVGTIKYRLPVPAHKENSIVVEKGNYLFTSIVCGAEYASQKTILKPIVVALGNSTSKID